MGSFNRKSEFRKPHKTEQDLLQEMKSSMSQICHFSEKSGGNNDAHWIMTVEADGLTTDGKKVL